jgi:hypothetical protein
MIFHHENDLALLFHCSPAPTTARHPGARTLQGRHPHGVSKITFWRAPRHGDDFCTPDRTQTRDHPFVALPP